MLRFSVPVLMALALCMSLIASQVIASPLLTVDTFSAEEKLENSEAEEIFRRGIQALLDEDHVEAERAFKDAASLQPHSAAPLLGLAEVARARGQISEAEALLASARTLEANQPSVHLAHGRFLRNQRDYAGAERAFLESTRVAGASAPGLLELGDLYLELRRPDESEKRFRQALELRSDSAFAHYGLGVALSMQGRSDEALAALRKATEIAPRDPAPLQALGRLHAERGEWDLALSRIDEALALAPHSPSMRLDRAEWLSARGDIESGIAAAEAVSADFPRLAEAHFRRANLLLRAGHRESAEQALNQTISLEPDNPVALNNLAWLLADRNAQLDEALGFSRRATKLAPSNPFFVHTLGRVHKARGEMSEGAAEFRKVNAMAPDYADAHYHLGLVLMALDDPQGAEKSLQKALDLGLNEDRRADALGRLATLRAGR